MSYDEPIFEPDPPERRQSVVASAATQSKTARPRMPQPAALEEILERYADGETLKEICLDPALLRRGKVFQIMREDEDFRSAFEIAEKLHADSIHADIAALERQALEEPDVANSIRVAIQSKQWRLSKLQPSKYGDKVSVAADIKQNVDMNLKASLTDDQLIARFIARHGNNAKGEI